jgi:WhiB family transcriptional regulator, redox-sensing transcriptional regulator
MSDRGTKGEQAQFLAGTSWMEHARCRDLRPEVFFPNDGAGVEVARRFCLQCPVRGPCLQHALENGIKHGVWGGTSERERERIRRRRGPNHVGKPAEPPT